jgi:hypothetical protein
MQESAMQEVDGDLTPAEQVLYQRTARGEPVEYVKDKSVDASSGAG